jgi:hypothetical protein
MKHPGKGDKKWKFPSWTPETPEIPEASCQHQRGIGCEETATQRLCQERDACRGQGKGPEVNDRGRGAPVHHIFSYLDDLDVHLSYFVWFITTIRFQIGT